MHDLFYALSVSIYSSTHLTQHRRQASAQVAAPLTMAGINIIDQTSDDTGRTTEFISIKKSNDYQDRQTHWPLCKDTRLSSELSVGEQIEAIQKRKDEEYNK